MTIRKIASLLSIAVPAFAFAQLPMPLGFEATDTGKTLPAAIRLDLAATGTWSDSTSANANPGIYDPVQWAVVYKYSGTLTLGNITFVNHPSWAPVIFLVDGDVVISGTVSVNGNGSNTSSGNVTVPGPGGFHGGAGAQPGFGPGGGLVGDYRGGSFGSLGSFATTDALYGNPSLFPLIGGSGGAGQAGNTGREGGAGGGALLIYASGTITLNGAITSNGGNGECAGGGGSGGGIRLVASNLVGGGTLRVDPGNSTCSGYYGGWGRIRLEYRDVGLTNFANMTNGGAAPVFSYKTLVEGDTPKVFTDPATDKSVVADRFVDPTGEAAAVVVPSDPRPRILGQLPVDVTLPRPGAWTLHVKTKNVPSDWKISARLVGFSNYSRTINTGVGIVETSGSDITWSVPVEDLPEHVTAVYVRADAPPATP